MVRMVAMALMIVARNRHSAFALTETMSFSHLSINLRRQARTTKSIPASTQLLSTSSSLNADAVTSLSSSSSSSSSLLAHRLDGLDKPTVWHEFSPLAVQYGSVNLGQGFPDWDPPTFVCEAMIQSVVPKYERHANQYARSYAHMPLAKVLAQQYTERWKSTTTLGFHDNSIDPVTEIATAVGCTNALFCALQGLISTGDEVILLEPAFDIYSSQVRMAGGTPVFVPLRPTVDSSLSASQVFTLDLQELEDAITPRTKLVLLNTPHNPTGKMFSMTELQGMAKIATDHNLIIISDEVYEHIVFDTTTEPHISMATLPGMWERTLTLSSSGKTFSCTGWKVGWAVGPPHLVKAVTSVQQWVNFSAPTPNQDAIAQCLQVAQDPYQGFSSYYAYLADDYKRKRTLLVDALASAGMNPVLPPGGFFIMADTSHIEFPYDTIQQQVTDAMPVHPMPRDWALSRWLTQVVGVTAIPPSAFYSPPNVHLAKNFLRFAFCKGDDTIREAHRRLEEKLGTGGRG